MTQQKSTITFHGGAGSVTGANFLVDTGALRVLVDCGLHQEGARCYVEDADFAYDPTQVDVLIVTHAHADHIGKIPKLVRDGFRGTIYSTPATKDLAEVMLADALMILTQEADRLGCAALYERADVRQTMELWRTIDYRQPFVVGDGVTALFLDAGHVLGSAMVRLERGGRVAVFTGDLGNSPELILPDTEKVEGAHYMVMESVYGDRNHESRHDRTAKLAQVIRENIRRGGTLLIPVFALQRAQVLLYEINKLVESGTVPQVPVYFDAPLAQRVTDIYRQYQHLYNATVRAEIRRGDDIFDFPRFVSVRNVADSLQIDRKKGPKIVIASSGMSNGGRVRMHERQILGNRKNTILFIGYQAFGTLGRDIADKHSKVLIDGTWVRVHARIENISGYSAHKDSNHLVEFVGDTATTLEHIFLAMGEPAAAQKLAQRLETAYHVTATVPRKGDTVQIDF